MLKAEERSVFVFLAESCDTGSDSLELQYLKARTVRGVDIIDQDSGYTVIRVKAWGRGPLQCEHELVEALR